MPCLSVRSTSSRLQWLLVSQVEFTQFTHIIFSNCLAALFLIRLQQIVLLERCYLLMLVLAATTLFFQNGRHPNPLPLIIISTILGFAVETKMSVVFTATFLQGLVYVTALRQDRRWITITACTIAAILPKVASLIIIWTYLNFDLGLLHSFVEGLLNVAKHNSGAGFN